MDLIKKTMRKSRDSSRESNTSRQSEEETLDNIQVVKAETHAEEENPRDQVLLDFMQDISRLVLENKKKKDTIEMATEFKNVNKMQQEFTRMKKDMKEMMERMEKKDKPVGIITPLAVEPPTRFASADRLSDNDSLRDSVQKNWPSFCQNRNSMFRGAKQPDLSIRQFLANMTALQETYGLSEREFLNQMRKAVGGQAYDFVEGHLAEGKCSVRQLYNYLLTRFDRAIPPEAAKKKLQALTAKRTDNLVRLLGNILHLIQQASQAVPPDFRQTYMDSEGAECVIRSLPVLSRNFARQKLVELQQTCDTPIPSFGTFAEVLTQHQQFINEDIEANASGYRIVNSLETKPDQQQKPEEKPTYERKITYRNNEQVPRAQRSQNTRQYTPWATTEYTPRENTRANQSNRPQRWDNNPRRPQNVGVRPATQRETRTWERPQNTYRPMNNNNNKNPSWPRNAGTTNSQFKERTSNFKPRRQQIDNPNREPLGPRRWDKPGNTNSYAPRSNMQDRNRDNDAKERAARGKRKRYEEQPPPPGMEVDQPWCRLCGMKNHIAAEQCWAMRDPNNPKMRVKVTPVKDPCSLCIHKTKVALHHPERHCIFKEEIAPHINPAILENIAIQ